MRWGCRARSELSVRRTGRTHAPYSCRIIASWGATAVYRATVEGLIRRRGCCLTKALVAPHELTGLGLGLLAALFSALGPILLHAIADFFTFVSRPVRFLSLSRAAA